MVVTRMYHDKIQTQAAEWFAKVRPRFGRATRNKRYWTIDPRPAEGTQKNVLDLMQARDELHKFLDPLECERKLDRTVSSRRRGRPKSLNAA